MKPYTVILKRCNQLIEENGSRILFLLLPSGLDDQRIPDTFFALPEENRLDLANPEKYPELYDISFYFDKGHLNDKGNRVLTKSIFKELESKEIFSKIDTLK